MFEIKIQKFKAQFFHAHKLELGILPFFRREVCEVLWYYTIFFCNQESVYSGSTKYLSTFSEKVNCNSILKLFNYVIIIDYDQQKCWNYFEI